MLETTELLEQSQHSFADRGLIAGEVKVDLPQMMSHKENVISQLDGGIQQLMKKNKIDRHVGHGKLLGQGVVQVSNGDDSTTISGKKILIATGSVSSSFPGMEPDGDQIGTSTEALSWPEIPKHLVVIGAGVIGLELGTVWRRMGAKVTVLEYLPRILPGTDSQIAKEAQKILKKQGLEFQLGTKVQKLSLIHI